MWQFPIPGCHLLSTFEFYLKTNHLKMCQHCFDPVNLLLASFYSGVSQKTKLFNVLFLSDKVFSVFSTGNKTIPIFLNPQMWLCRHKWRVCISAEDIWMDFYLRHNYFVLLPHHLDSLDNKIHNFIDLPLLDQQKHWLPLPAQRDFWGETCQKLVRCHWHLSPLYWQ